MFNYINYFNKLSFIRRPSNMSPNICKYAKSRRRFGEIKKCRFPAYLLLVAFSILKSEGEARKLAGERKIYKLDSSNYNYERL